MAKMKNINLALVLIGLLLIPAPVSAFWRLLCHGQVGVVRIDPLADFGMISDHAHAVHGANNFLFNTTADDLMTSDCTSCSITQDRSVYWTPPLYFENSNGTFTLVPQKGGMTVYYLNDKAPGEYIKAFPKGFSMISGDARQRNFTLPIPDPPESFWTANDTTQSALAQKAIGFNCLNYYTKGFVTEGSREYHYIRNKTFTDENCPDGLRLEVLFPSCWNGRDLTSANHKSHIQFPELVQTGACPPGFPVRTPVLFYETIFDVKLFKDYPGRFVLANGDFTGYGYHGDFIAGWDPEFLQKALDVCNNTSGLQEDCHLFNLQSEGNATACTMTVPECLRDDDTHGPRNSLPGDHPIYSGPGYAPACEGTLLPPYAAVSAMPTMASSGEFSSAPITIPPTSPPTASGGPSAYSTTTYTSDGMEVVMVVVVEEVTVTAEKTVTEINSAMKRHLARHQHHY